MLPKPNQSDLTFYLNVYHDLDCLYRCLTQLRQIYPQSRVIIRADGDNDPTIVDIAKTFSCSYFRGQRLMGIERGGEIVHEMIRLFLTQETAYLFKIDPDTRLSRPFVALPNEPSVFGTLQHQEDLYSIQGGCIGFTNAAAERLYASNLLLTPALSSCSPPWAITPALLRRSMQLGLTSIDWAVGWACQQLEIPLIDWPEIMSEWQVTPENDDLRYAVTHPHKSGLPVAGAFPCAIRSWKDVVSVTGHAVNDHFSV